MGDDCDVQIPSLQPNQSPDQPVPQGDPVEVLKSIEQKRVKRKYHGASDEGQRREASDATRVPQARLEFSEPSQEKAAEIQFHDDRNTADEPRDHEQERNLAMWCRLEEGDVVAKIGIGRQNHERIQETENEPGQESPAQADQDVPSV